MTRIAVSITAVFLVLAMALFGCGLRRAPEPEVTIPVEEPGEDKPEGQPEKPEPAPEEDIVETDLEEPVPRVAIERKSVRDLLKEDLPPRRKASLSLTDQARELIEAGEPDRAVVRLEKALNIDGRNGHAYYYLALARYLQGDMGQAITLCGTAYLNLGSDRYFGSKALLLRSKSYMNQDDRQAAVRDCLDSLRLDPGNEEALRWRLELRESER